MWENVTCVRFFSHWLRPCSAIHRTRVQDKEDQIKTTLTLVLSAPWTNQSRIYTSLNYGLPLWWRHYERDGVSNHQPHDCLLSVRQTVRCHGDCRRPQIADFRFKWIKSLYLSVGQKQKHIWMANIVDSDARMSLYLISCNRINTQQKTGG